MEKIKEFFVKQSVGFYVSCLAVVLLIISAILYTANSTHMYYTDFNSKYLMGIISALLLLVAVIVLSQFFSNNKFLFVGITGAVVLVGLIAFYFINGRVETIAYVFASDLEAGNQYAQFATRQAIVAFVFMLTSVITMVVSSFFNIVKKIKT